MTHEELLLNLRDIAAPPEPQWWHLAPVYIVAAILFLLITITVVFWIRRQRTNRAFLQAQQALSGIKTEFSSKSDSRQLAIALSRWLKQVSLRAFPEHQVASLTGTEWLRFLDQSCNGPGFSEICGALFSQSVYSRNPDFNAARVFEHCEIWLFQNKSRLKGRGHF